ncbi:glutamine amidotransferase-like class 1 domain-containing protein 3A, mitochondrial isoform X1 [Canis lupus familiaris]|nr:glutamine amidotransferase-like class 1 domain-containing protein 3A, mitochondrial isoform X1 [Canis lupus familiaris]XP_038317599.1 glutamine amidotransferase-like class 1 domain-containing protein 3A, mitochondrial isoform X1 [Canis lupus familiaris]
MGRRASRKFPLQPSPPPSLFQHPFPRLVSAFLSSRQVAWCVTCEHHSPRPPVGPRGPCMLRTAGTATMHQIWPAWTSQRSPLACAPAHVLAVHISVLERGEGSAWSPPWEKLPRSPALPGAPRTAPWGCVSRVLLGQALCRSSLLVKVVAVGPAVRLVCSEETLRSRQGADDSGATCLSPPGMPSLERHPTWGLCCIASVLAAKVLHGVEVTVGHEQEEGGRWPYAGTAEAIKALGAKHCVKEVTEAHVDKKNKVVTTPAFMCETELHHVHDGIGAMVKKVLELCAK